MTTPPSPSTATGLRVHAAERTDVLVTALAKALATSPADPFQPDVVAVPTRGVERWVAQRLSHHLGAVDADGICANVLFPSPRRLVADVLAGTRERDDPWARDALTWHVLTTIDAHLHEDWLSVVRRYIDADDAHRSRRVRFAQRVARLFTSYDAQRPRMLRSWADEADDDGTGQSLPDDLRWQPRLWRAVRATIGTPGPSERIGDVIQRLTDDPDAVDLPHRISVFGATHLPDTHLQVLSALAQHREVHLWLPQPSLALWRRVEPAAPGTRRTRMQARHPLLASMAGDATELAARVKDYATSVEELATPARPSTALGALQQRIADDQGHAAKAPHDRTVQIHSTHGRSRQVEVLREVIVGLLADDDTLQPRDIIVMCPDVEAFAPLVEAALGATAEHDQHPGRELRVRIADRAPAQQNPVLGVVQAVLELADSRVGASAVVDLAGQAPVRRRFRFDDAELDRIRQWALESGVHWGEDVERRARYGLGRVPQGTWATALDRLLLGVAMAEEDQRYVGAVLPVDDVGSTDVDLVGRLAEFVDRLTGTLHALEGTQPGSSWFDALDRAVTLLTDVTPQDAWQQDQAARVLSAARDQAGATTMRLADVVALLEPALAGRPTRSGFRTGALTVCSLAPMRAVPHRVVALLGMDDGAFPRATTRDGDDILARSPLVGERDARQEDRQLFLDAVTSATDHLVVVYSGADERTGAERPPAVPVGELLDALDTAVDYPGGARAHVVHHPLQTVDERNFVRGALGRPAQPFSFDVLDLAAARRGREGRPVASPFVASPLPAQEVDDVDLTDLVATLEHPVRAFVRQRLGATLPHDEPQLDDRLPLDLDALERWSIGDRLLQAALDGVDLDAAGAAERRRGHMPPGALGSATFTQVRAQVEPLLRASAPYLTVAPTALDVAVALTGTRRLAGTVTGVRDDVLVRTVFSRLAAKHRMRAWVELLALAATFPERTFSAVTVGRGQGSTMRVARLTAPPNPVELLRGLVEIYDEAMREPLPLPLATSLAYAHPRSSGGDEPDALASARKELGTADDAAGGRGGFEAADGYHLLALGDPFTFEVLRQPPTDTDRARQPREHTRFGALAMALWTQLLWHEEVAQA